MTSSLAYFGVAPADIVETENRSRYTAVLAQTTFSATYTVGYVDVLYNGSELDPSTDYTATDGAHIILTNACVGGESIQIIAKRQVPNIDVYTKEETNTLLSNYYGAATGTGDVLALTTSPTFTTYTDGLEIKLRVPAANTTTAPTLSCNSIVAKTIYRSDRTAIAVGSWLTNTEITVRYVQIIDAFVVVTDLDTVPTPVQFNSSNLPATTAWTNALGLHIGQVLSYTGSTTLSATLAGSLVNLGGAGNYVVALPQVSTVGVGSGFVLSNTGTGAVTITVSNLGVSDTTDSGTTVVIEPGARYCIVSDGVSNWRELYWANQVSPTFSGVPTTTTPTKLDNSPKIANTAWAYELGQNYGPSTVSSAAATLALSQTQLGALISLTSSSPQTITLPDITGLNVGNTLSISRDVTSTSTAIINSFNGLTNILVGNVAVSTLSITSGETCTLVFDGTNWKMTGTSLLKKLGFPSSLGASGAQGVPTGFTEQWGSFSLTTSATATNGWYESSGSITFPASFNNNVVAVSPTILDGAAGGLKLTTWYSAPTVSGFTIWVSGATANRAVTGTWRAIGY